MGNAHILGLVALTVAVADMQARTRALSGLTSWGFSSGLVRRHAARHGRALDELVEAIEDWRITVEHVFEAGDGRVLVTGSSHVRGKGAV